MFTNKDSLICKIHHTNRILGLIQACLHLNPSDRPSAQSLLGQDYFMHDDFQNQFLPELRRKVQKEFSSNALLVKESKATKIESSSSSGSSKKTKHRTSTLFSPEAIYGKNFAQTQSSSRRDSFSKR